MGAAETTSVGGERRELPSTSWATILEARHRDPGRSREALNELCRLYWKPVYAHIRAARRLSNERAKDLTQDFFLEILEGRLLSHADPGRGRFRSYLRGALRLFLFERHREGAALKRGGDRVFLPLGECELEEADSAGAASAPPADDAFDRQWMRSVIDLAVQDLRERLAAAGQDVRFRVFERHQLHPPPGGAPSHEELAAEFRIRASDVNHHLAEGRRQLRELIERRIRETVASEGDVQEEINHLFSA